MSQVIANALVSASGYLLVGLGFSLIYISARFFHFAHGIVLTVGAYAIFVLRVWCGVPLPTALIGGILASSLSGCSIEWCLYKPLRRRGASSAALLLTSLGIYAALQALVAMIFGSGTQTFRQGEIPEGLLLGTVRLTVPQIALITCGTICCFLTWAFLQLTRPGKRIRAAASDPELALAYGLDCDSIILTAFALGSALAGIAAGLFAADGDITPWMGFRPLLMGMVAAVIGGVGSIPGIAMGSLLLALAQHIGAWWISSRWQDAIAMIVLLFFLAFRPQGFLGKPLRSASV